MKNIKCSNECEVSLDSFIENPTESNIKVWESMYMDNIKPEGIDYPNYYFEVMKVIIPDFWDSYRDFKNNRNDEE